MPRFALLFALIFPCCVQAVAQEHPSVAAQSNSVYVGADGKYEAVPDTAVIQFNISVQEDHPQAAYDHAAKETEQCGKCFGPMAWRPSRQTSDSSQYNRPMTGDPESRNSSAIA